MANIKFEIDGKVYDFAPESFAIDNEGNIILKSKPSVEKMNPFESNQSSARRRCGPGSPCQMDYS